MSNYYRPIKLGDTISILNRKKMGTRMPIDNVIDVMLNQKIYAGNRKSARLEFNKQLFQHQIFRGTEFNNLIPKFKEYKINAKNPKVFLQLSKDILTEKQLTDTIEFKNLHMRYTGMNPLKIGSFLGNVDGIPILEDNKILIPDIEFEKEVKSVLKKRTKNLYHGYYVNNLPQFLKQFNSSCYYEHRTGIKVIRYRKIKDVIFKRDDVELNLILKRLKGAKQYVTIVKENGMTFYDVAEIQENLSELFDALTGNDMKEFKHHQEKSRAVSKTKIDDKLFTNLIINAELYDHQKQGISWLYGLYKAKLPGAILADDMGMGKTIQTLTFLELSDAKTITIVCPASVISVWHLEIDKFLPQLNNRKINIYSFESYAKLINVKTDVLIVDEAQRAKNKNTLNNKALSATVSKFNILLSGTPIENKIQDIYNILSIIDPIYSRIYNILARITKDEVLLAHKTTSIIDGIYLRRLKTKKQLAAKLSIVNVNVQMNKEETLIHNKVKKFYGNSIIRDKATNNLSYYNDVVIALIRLRQTVSYHKQLEKLDFLKNNTFNMVSSKELMTLKLIKDNKDSKFIIFTEFTETLKRLNKVIPNSLAISGSTPSSKRGDIIKEFQHNDKINTIIVSTKAGNSGITLHAANKVILYDLWWNPAIIQQAIARSYRIGQQRDVTAYMLVSKNSIDENILRIIDLKREIIGSFDGTSTPSSNLEKDSTSALDRLTKLTFG